MTTSSRLASQSLAFQDSGVDNVRLSSALNTLTVSGNGGANVLITGVADPVNDFDAVNKKTVDNLLNGLKWKEPVDAATTADVADLTTLINGFVLDGVTLATGNRILVKD